MKLMYCPNCNDVLALRRIRRECQCGRSYGFYEDVGPIAVNAVIGGEAIALGFANLSFKFALVNRPKEGMGKRFDAFVIPKICPTIEQR